MVTREMAVRGYGQDWGQTRSFSNRLSSNTNTSANGNGWFIREVPQLGKDASSNIAVIGVINDALWFDYHAGTPPTYTGRFFIAETLTENTTTKEFTFTDTRGQVTKFYSFDSSIPAAQQGQLKSITDPYGSVYTPTYTTSSSISSLTMGASPGITFNYSYYSTGNNAGKLQYVTHQRGSTNVRRVSYVYYDTGDSNGNLGDLKESTVQQWNGSSWDNLGTTYYRYYTSNTSPGYQYGLKFVVRPQAYAAMVAASITPETTDDTTLGKYADHYFEYNNSTDKRVSKEVINAQGSTSSSATSPFAYAYTPSGNSNGFNNWSMKNVETQPGPDGNTNTVYTNYAGQVMLKILTRASDGKKWYEYYQYDSNGRVILQANSSAIASVSEGSPGLVTLNTSSGLIRVFYYYTTTNLAVGAVAGMLQYEKVKQGSSGTEVTVREVWYTSQTANGITIYPISKDIRYQSDSGGGSSPAETDFSYVFFTGTLRVQQKTTTWPAISTGQNGSGTANSRVEVFDQYGFLTWIKDERGFLTRFQTDQATGAVTQRIDDVNTSLITDNPPVPSGWSTPSGGGLHLINDYTVDNLGRTTLELGPSHSIDLSGTSTTLRRLHQTLYVDTLPSIWQASGYATGTAPNYSYTLIDPITVSNLDQSGRVIDSIVSTRIAGATGLLSLSGAHPDSFTDQTRWVRWTKNFYNNNEQSANYRYSYFSIPSSGLGTNGTNYNETDYGFDAMERLNRIQSPGGTITRWVFHVRGLMTSQWIGTNDTGATDSDPTGGGALGNNMVQVKGYEYDNGDTLSTPSGDGVLTKLTLYQDGSTTRVTTYGYDFRNRRTSETGPINFYAAYSYDNQDRLTQVDRRNTNASGNLIARSNASYDLLGRMYQLVHYAVNPSTGTVGNSLNNGFWYDPSGALIKVKRTGSSALYKLVYDGAGRITKQYQTFNTAETGYPYPISVANDTVFQQTESSYDAANNLIQQTTRHRMHDASGTGELANPSTSPTARVYYQAYWPDALGRAHNEANYGTNGASSFTRPATAPARSDTVLVSTTDFNNHGEAYQFTDPKGVVTLLAFDNAGRQTQRLDNYVSGGSNPDQNRETDFTYNADGRLQHLTAKNSVTGDQVTKYVYGVDLSNSDVASNDLLHAIIYPDSTDSENPLSGTNHVELQYNRLGQIKQRKDQLGTIHTLEYDGLGRLAHDRITTLASGVDNAVLRVSRTYEVRGMLQNITSYNNANVGMGSVVNDVQFAYNSFAQLTTEYQSHSGAVNTSTSPKVQYAYADGSANTIRPTSITYPGGTVTTYDYGTSGGTDDLLSRVTSIKQGATILVGYTYLGINQIVQANYSSQPGVALTYIKQSGESNGDAGDQYTGLDRFGRVVDQRWLKTSSGVALERVQYGFDRDSNRQWRQNLVQTTGQDEYYTYDGLSRLSKLQRGTLNAGHTGLTSTPTWEEDFNFDPTGNWHGTTTGYKTLVNGSTTLDQNRSNSLANEISGITTNSGTAWGVPAYDLNGNATSIPQPAALASSFTCAYDAWNRLMNVKNGPTTIATYRYDGRNRRVQKITSVTRDYYYSSRWQVVEERVSTPTPSCPERQFVWGLRYDDDLVLRDRVSSQSSSSTCQSSDERLYVLHDFFHVTAVVNTGGTVLERYGYDAYGSVRFMDGSFNSRSSSSYAWETLYGAYRWDSDTGLYHVRNRYLHSRLGTWLTRDSKGYHDGLNLYVYGRSNAPTLVDPSGTWCWPYICTPAEDILCACVCAANGQYPVSCRCYHCFDMLPWPATYDVYVANCSCTDPGTIA